MNQGITGVETDAASRRPLRTWLLVVALALVGMSASVAGFIFMQQWGRERAEAAFTLKAQERIAAVRREVEIEIEALRSLASLFDSSEVVEEPEFETFVVGALQRNPGLLGLGYVRRVAHIDRARAEQELGRPIIKMTTSGPPRPVGDREEYYPFWFVRARSGDHTPLAMDFTTEPIRAEALRRALSTGDVAVSAPVRPIIADAPATSVVGVLPLYERRPGGGRGPVYGAVSSAVATDEVVKSALALLGHGGVDLSIYDADAGYAPLYGPSRPPDAQTPLVTVSEVIGGRRWVVTAGPASPLPADFWEAWAVLGAGLLLTTLAVMNVATSISRHDAARLVRERTTALRAANAALETEVEEHKRAEARLAESELRFRQLADNTDAVFWVATPAAKRVDYVSPAYERVWGRTPDALFHDSSVFFDFIHPDDQDRVRRAVAVQTRVPYDIEYRIIRPDGEVRWIRDRSVPVGDVAHRAAGIADDITQRRAAAEALRDSEERLRRVFEAVVDPVWEWDVPADRTSFSPSWETLVGYDRGELTDRIDTWENLVHPDDRAAVWAALNACLGGDLDSYEAEYRLRTKSGQWKWVLSRGRVVDKDADGRATRMIGSITDITDRKRAEVALRESEARQRAVLAAIPDCMFRMRRDGTYLDYHVPDGAPLLTPPDAFMGRRCDEVLPLSVSAPTLEAIDGALRSGELRTFEYSGRGDNPRRWEVRIIPCAEDEVLAITRDVSEQRRAQEALRASEARYRQIVETAHEGIWTIDARGVTTFANARMAEMLGRTVPDMLGRPMYDFMDESARATAEQNLERRRRGLREEHDFCFRRADGRDVWTMLSTSPMHDPAGDFQGALAMVTDITDRKHAEKALRASEERYRLLFESNPQPMWVFDAETLRFLNVNAAAVHAYGYSREEFLAMTIRDIRPPDEADRLDEFMRTTSGATLTNAGVWRHKRKDGAVIEVDIVSHEVPFMGARNRLVLATDVTEARRSEAERRRAEEALRDSEERNRRIVEALPNGLMFVSADGRLLQGNANAIEFLGLAPGELTRRFAADFEPHTIREDGSPCPVDEYPAVRCLRTGAPAPPTTIGVHRPDGSLVWGVFRAVPLLDRDGRTEAAVVTFLDITHRRAAEQALRVSEERYRVVAEQTGQVVYDYDVASGDVVRVGAIEDVTGYAPEEFAHATIAQWEDHLHPDDRARVLDAIASVKRDKGHFRMTYRLRRKDGVYATILDNGLLVTNAGDGRERLLGAMQDITARMKADRALRDSEERFRSLSTCSSIGIFMSSPAGEVSWTNPRLQEIAGFTFDDAMGDGWTAHVHPSDAPWLRQGWQRAAAAAQAFDAEFRFQHASGDIHWVRATTAPMFSDSGDLIGHVGAVEDITDRKLAEEALQGSEERYRRLVESSPDGIFVHQDGRLVFANAAAGKLFAAPDPAALIGAEIHRFMHSSTRAEVLERIRALYDGTPKVPLLDQRLVRLDGTVFDAEVQGSTCMFEGRPAIQVVARDVSDRKAAEARLRFQASVLSQVDDAVIALDESRRITYLNAAAARIYGVEPTDVLGQPAQTLFSQLWIKPEDEAHASIALRREGRWEGLSLHLKRSGRRFYAESAMSVLRDDQGRAAGVLAVIRDVSDRIRWEQRQSLMMAELDHRVKNNLAAVLSIADQTIRASASLADFGEAFTGRIRALARMHGVLAQSQWKGARLGDLARQSLEAYMIGRGSRVFIDGPDVLLPARAASPVCMALHELATNAAKYGALSVPGGRVDVRWSLAANADGTPRVDLNWSESGGPSVVEPPRRGFGTELIEGGIAYELHGTVGITFRAEGLVCDMSIPLEEEPDRLTPADNGEHP